MTDQAEDPIEPTPAKAWKSRARGDRQFPAGGLAASIATATYAQDILARSPVLDAVRHLQSSGAMAAMVQQISAASAVRDAVSRSPVLDAGRHLHSVGGAARIAGLVDTNPALRAVEQMQRCIGANLAIDVVRLSPVLEAVAAATKYQQAQVVSLMPAMSALTTLAGQAAFAQGLVERHQANIWSTINMAASISAWMERRGLCLSKRRDQRRTWGSWQRRQQAHCHSRPPASRAPSAAASCG